MVKRTLFDAFNDEFAREIKQARNYNEAYERATEKFEKDHGFIAFGSYDSYRKRKSRRFK